jgi:hypothetical protein
VHRCGCYSHGYTCADLLAGDSAGLYPPPSQRSVECRSRLARLRGRLGCGMGDVRMRQPLTAWQVEVLAWIGQGCPDGVMSGRSYKHTARALQDRKLVVIDKRKGGWTARLTEAGQHYRKHGKYPARPTSAASSARRAAATSNRAAQEPATPRSEHGPTAEELLNALREGSGVVRVPDPDPATRAGWRRAIDAAKRGERIPGGQHLRHRGRDQGDLVIELRSGAHPERHSQTKPPSIAIPESLDELAPDLVEPARTAMRGLDVAAEVRDRALRIVCALACDASVRGMRVEWVGQPPWLMRFSSMGHSVGLTLTEEREARHELPSLEDLPASKKYSWQRVQAEVRDVPSGRLAINIGDAGFPGRKHRWADRQRWRLEDKLGEIMAEVQMRPQLLAQKLQAKEEAERQHQRDWERAMEQAHRSFHQACRVAALNDQVDRWERAERVRACCDALERVDDERAESRREWIEWARQHVAEIDPRGRDDHAPAETEPTPEDLRPYLKGRDPYRPMPRNRF